MTEDPSLTAPAGAPAETHAPPGHAPTPPAALPPDDALRSPVHGHTLPASRPSDAYVPLRRWVVEEPAQLREMRGDLREQLAASTPATLGPDADLPDNVVLVTSELATNALAHGHPPAHVRLLVDGAALLVVVSDGDPTHAPFLAEGRDPGEGGFGLQIARRLSAEVGWWSDASGKHVWAAFERDQAL